MALSDPGARKFLGVAGPQLTDQERACVKQAVFLLRYRMRLHDAAAPLPE